MPDQRHFSPTLSVPRTRGRPRETFQAPISVEMEETERLLNDPAYDRVRRYFREKLIAQLENLAYDGTEEAADLQDEICRTLRTHHKLHRLLVTSVQEQRLSLANFKSVPKEDK